MNQHESSARSLEKFLKVFWFASLGSFQPAFVDGSFTVSRKKVNRFHEKRWLSITVDYVKD
jgi:hypothetical protein